MRIIKICIFLLSLNILAQNPALNSAEEDAFKTRVVKKATGINSFSAEFHQTKHLETMDGSPESSGRVFYQSPDLLKWEYTSPYNYQVLFRDSRLFIAEDGAFSEIDLSSSKLFEKMGELVSGSVNGKILQADEDFKITYHKEKQHIQARIIPKNKSLSGMFSEIWISFNSDYLIKSIRLIDPSGDFTEVFMKNIKINQPIPPSVFEN